MKSSPLILTALLFLLPNPNAFASLYDTKINGVLLFDLFKKEGISEKAIQRTFEFLDLNEGKTISVREESKMIPKTITAKDYTVIIDFTKPSSERRLYLMNLKTGLVEKFYVAHGTNTGLDESQSFANMIDSRKSALGLYLTGSTYVGTHGRSLYLYGLEKSNDLAFERSIVVHGAPYVSLEYLADHKRMGQSWGCFAVSEGIIEKLLAALQGGAIINAHHDQLMLMTQTSPTIQSVSGN